MFVARNLERVTHDIYLVKHPFEEPSDLFVGVTVVVGLHSVGLIDTGFRNTPKDYVFPFLESIGRNYQEIDYVVNTHSDGDHVEGNVIIKEKTKAKIAAHELDEAAIGNVDMSLGEGDVVELGDRQFRVIHTPGHTPGSISLYDAKDCTLVTGDSVCGKRRTLIRMSPSLYMSSLKKLQHLGINILVIPHPFKPLGKAVLVGREATEMITASISTADQLLRDL
jgi:glyoxylase-like metal-dependent hydrolase (beta-lactamase superfamily II)